MKVVAESKVAMVCRIDRKTSLSNFVSLLLFSLIVDPAVYLTAIQR